MLRTLTWHEGNQVSGPCLHLICCLLTNGGVCELQEDDVPAGELKLRLTSSTWTKCCNHHCQQAGDMAGVGLPVARVASLLVAKLSFRRPNRFEPKYI